jgi:hypothetical protein
MTSIFISPYIVTFFALTFAALSALTLIRFVNGLDAQSPLPVAAHPDAEQVAA